MKKSLLISTITGVTLSLLLANGALAGHKHHHKHQYRHTGYDHRGHGDYARVVEARPIYQRIEAQVPQPVQWSEWTVGIMMARPFASPGSSVIASPRIGQTRTQMLQFMPL